jgi:hypothetical protein
MTLELLVQMKFYTEMKMNKSDFKSGGVLCLDKNVGVPLLFWVAKIF